MKTMGGGINMKGGCYGSLPLQREKSYLKGGHLRGKVGGIEGPLCEKRGKVY